MPWAPPSTPPPHPVPRRSWACSLRRRQEPLPPAPGRQPLSLSSWTFLRMCSFRQERQSPQHLQQSREIPPGRFVCRVEPQGGLAVLDGLGNSPGRDQQAGEVIVGVDIIGTDFQGLPILLDGLVVPARAAKGVGQIVVSLRPVGAKGQGVPAEIDGPRRSADGAKGDAQIAESLERVGGGPQGGAVVLYGLLGFSRAKQAPGRDYCAPRRSPGWRSTRRGSGQWRPGPARRQRADAQVVMGVGVVVLELQCPEIVCISQGGFARVV